jgi:hypothetical protein
MVLAIRAVLRRDGVDVSKIKFIEVPFPDSLNRPSIDLTASQAQRFGYTKGKVAIDQLIWSGATAG